MSAITSKSANGKSVELVALQPIRHDGKRYAVGDPLRLPESQATALIDTGAAELKPDTKAESKAKADAEAKAKADAEAKAKADAEAKAKADAEAGGQTSIT